MTCFGQKEVNVVNVCDLPLSKVIIRTQHEDIVQLSNDIDSLETCVGNDTSSNDIPFRLNRVGSLLVASQEELRRYDSYMVSHLTVLKDFKEFDDRKKR